MSSRAMDLRSASNARNAAEIRRRQIANELHLCWINAFCNETGSNLRPLVGPLSNQSASAPRGKPGVAEQQVPTSSRSLT